MKKISRTLAVALCAIAMTSCIGSFRLTNNLLDWNRSVGSKFVNEAVFLGFSILPVYEVAIFLDAVVFNSIEFWGGTVDLASNQQIFEGDGTRIAVSATEDGYHFRALETGDTMDMVYSSENRTWSAVTSSGEYKILTETGDNKAQIYNADGQAVEVVLNQEGIAALEKAVSMNF